MSAAPKPVAQRWERLAQALFDEGVAREILAHASNLVMGTLILAAGIWAITKADGREIPSVVDVGIAGYIVAAIGVVLLVLNLADGLHKLSKVRRPWLLQVLAATVYVFISIRVAQLVLAFRV